MTTTMRQRGIAAILSTAAVMALLLGVGAPANAAVSNSPGTMQHASVPLNPTPAPASRYDPAAVAARCVPSDPKAKLLLYSSTAKGSSQITPKSGDYVPVLLVHGWTGDAGSFTAIADRSSPGYPASKLSLVGQLQAIPGAAVYGYDYSKEAARWITTTYAGLAKAISCLSDQTGRKVIVVTHSMGGLNTRLAVAQKGIASKVSRIIDFGTPVTGSIIAREVWDWVGGTADNQQGVWHFNYTQKQQLQQLFRSFLFSCSQQGDAGSLNACGKGTGMEGLITNFEGDAGRNLRVNTPQIRAIAARKWPAGVDVYSLYGNFDLGYLGATPIAQALMLEWVPIINHISNKLYNKSKDVSKNAAVKLDLKHPGDLIVPTSSATYDTPKNHQYSIRCAPFDPDLKDSIHSTTGSSPMSSPCFHGNLYRSPKLDKKAVQWVMEQVNAEIVPWVNPQQSTVDTPQWQITQDGFGPLHAEDLAYQVSAVTNLDYTDYLRRFLTLTCISAAFGCSAPASYCEWAPYQPLTKLDAGLAVEFSPSYGSTFDELIANERLANVWVYETADPAVNAKLPRMASGIGLGSSLADLKAAYPGTAYRLDGTYLLDITASEQAQGMAPVGAGDQYFQVQKVNAPDALHKNAVINFKLSNGTIIAMQWGTAHGIYADIPYICATNNKKPMVPAS